MTPLQLSAIYSTLGLVFIYISFNMFICPSQSSEESNEEYSDKKVN